MCVCVCEREIERESERERERESQLQRRVCVCVCVCVLACEREGDKVTQTRLVCKHIQASLWCLSRDSVPLWVLN